MLYLGVFIAFISLFLFFYGLFTILKGSKIKIEKRIDQLQELNNADEEITEGRPFTDRMLRPFYTSVSSFLLKATPGSKLAALNKKLEASGLLKNTTPQKWLYRKCMVTIALSSMTVLLSFLAEPSIVKAIALGLLSALLINTSFNFTLSRKIEIRKKKILRDLPYTLDLITVSVEAGLSFDGAMARVVTNISGELCDEFSKSLKEIRMGIERKTALKSMSDRCSVRELSMLVTSLIQADDLGVSLSRVLRIEAANLREHRRQSAREKAMKAPVKMLFPLVFFIFPTIFIIILGPAVIKIMSIF